MGKKETSGTGNTGHGTFTEMAEDMEKKSGLGRLAKMLDEIVGDVTWGRKSLAALTIGGILIGGAGIPTLMEALLPYVQANAFTALLTTNLGAGVIGGAAGMAGWGLKGIGGTINAGIKTIRKNNADKLSAKQKAKKLRKSVGRLPKKDLSKLNIDSDRFIVRNGILMAVAEDAQGKNVGIRLVNGVTAISRNAFQWDDMDKPLTITVPESVLALNLEGMPHNTRLIFDSPMSKYELLDELKYDPSLRKHVLGDSRFDIPGGTYQKHLYECELLEEENPRPVTRWTGTVKEDMAMLSQLPENKQKLLLEGAYESMVKGGITIIEFRNMVRCSTIPIQEFKGPVTDHCSQEFINYCRRQWYVNETVRLAKGNPSITEMDAFLKELRRVAQPVKKETAEKAEKTNRPAVERSRIPVRQLSANTARSL